jgi:hypothetical protein
VGVADRPPQPLDELGGEVLRLQVGEAHPLTQHDCIFTLLAVRISKHDYLRHRFLLVYVYLRLRVAPPNHAAVNIS